LPRGGEFFDVGACSRCSAPWVSDAVIGFCGEGFSFSDAILEEGAAHFFLRLEWAVGGGGERTQNHVVGDLFIETANPYTHLFVFGTRARVASCASLRSELRRGRQDNRDRARVENKKNTLGGS
jgi:hypothetical protein